MLETKFHAGRRAEVESVIAEAVAATREDPQAINHEFFWTTTCYIAERFLSKADITRFTVYGSPAPRCARSRIRSEATYQEVHAGFARRSAGGARRAMGGPRRTCRKDAGKPG